jgi:glycosyltransferase involved in cell wall biosynthesis
MTKALKIAVTGTRGFPDIQGGIEKHCENLYVKLVERGCDVTVFCRQSYFTYDKKKYKGVTLIPLYCPRSKYLETVFHTFIAVLKARKLNIDALHIHSIGASFFTPLARLLGMKVVVTHHGQDYKREKWNVAAKTILKICEIVGMMCANEVIVITKEISDHIDEKFHRDSTIIPNGVSDAVFQLDHKVQILEKYGLQKKRYILAVGRFVAEKAFDVLIDAYNKIHMENWKLVIVGSADHKDKSTSLLEKKAAGNPNIVMTGFLKGTPLHVLYSHAGLFVIPSYFEGLPIVLLEAMSYGLSCIASDIAGNRSVLLDEGRYFRPGDKEMLKTKIIEFARKPWTEEMRSEQIQYINETYNWDAISRATLDVYRTVSIDSRIYKKIVFGKDSRLKIAVLGTRGFPNVQGGVEIHCQNLYQRLVERGCDIIVITRKPYVDLNRTEYRGVKLRPISCPRSKYLEAFIHTIKGILAVNKLRPDILHIHAIGPSLFSPFAKGLGIKTVVTHHGENYKHMKWGFTAKQILKLCELVGMKCSDGIIAVSDEIALSVKKKFNRDAVVLPNGVDMPSSLSNNNEELSRRGLEKGRYVLNVGRFVPEKGVDVLIHAFKKASLNDWKLVIIGRADHHDDYSKKIMEESRENSNIILTGFLTGDPLNQLYERAGLFVLSSYYEGLPIVLLEALSYGLSCIASDIPGNRAIKLDSDRYFTAGDVDMLQMKLREFAQRPWKDEDREKLRSMVTKTYNWQTIADNTVKVYQDVVSD